uniref:Uncharacterized protein n=1 Tax=Arundo donax TaxID=35708 RepID=A0A0A8YZM1_ARUDO
MESACVEKQLATEIQIGRKQKQ